MSIVVTGKRAVVFLLIFFIIFSAGCTNGTDDEQSHEKEEALLKPLTLRILTTGDSSFSGRQHEFAKIVDMASAMTMEKYNTAFVIDFIKSQEDFVSRVLSGEPADIISFRPKSRD